MFKSNHFNFKKRFGFSHINARFEFLSAEKLLPISLTKPHISSFLNGKPKVQSTFFDLFRRLFSLTALETEAYQHYYLPFIHRFAESVQFMPSRVGGPLYSMIHDSFWRAFKSLKKYVEDNPHTSWLERYALFTAAALIEIPQLWAGQRLLITDKQGTLIREWVPGLEELPQGDEKYYRILSFIDTDPNLRFVASLLAEKMLPPQGFKALYFDRPLFSQWLATLYHQDSGEALHFATLIYLFRYHSDEEILSDILSVEEIEFGYYEETEYLGLIFDILSEKIVSGELQPSENFYVHDNFVFINPAFIQDIIGMTHVKGITLPVVLHQLGNAMGFVQLSGEDKRFNQLFSKNMHHGKPYIRLDARLFMNDSMRQSFKLIANDLLSPSLKEGNK